MLIVFKYPWIFIYNSNFEDLAAILIEKLFIVVDTLEQELREMIDKN